MWTTTVHSILWEKHSLQEVGRSEIVTKNLRWYIEYTFDTELRSFLVRSRIFSEQVIDENDDIAEIFILLLPTWQCCVCGFKLWWVDSGIEILKLCANPRGMIPLEELLRYNRILNHWWISAKIYHRNAAESPKRKMHERKVNSQDLKRNQSGQTGDLQ